MAATAVNRALLTRAEVAERLALSVRTLDHLISKGKISAVRIGRSVRIHREELIRVEREGVQ